VIFYQHIGEALSGRDSPRSIGTPSSGLMQFELEELIPYLHDVPVADIELARSSIQRIAQGGFQVWGLPGPAEHVIRNMKAGGGCPGVC
jgi:hypothetical protein